MRTRLARAALFAAAAAGLAAACSKPAPRTHTVEIRAFKFHPETLTVALGDTVVWTNHDILPHTARDTVAAWDSGNLDAQASWRFVATKPGVQQYHCEYHPTMVGVLVVK